MRELAEALKRRAGLRMRQGVVTGVDGSTCSVLIGGSTVAVDGVQHLNSCAPAVNDVVWITSDGADLWIIGTHGDPPPIDMALLPAFDTYFTDADTVGDPAPVTGLAGAAGFSGVLLSWDLPAEAQWRTWEVYEGATSGFTPGEPVAVATQTVIHIPHNPESGPLYFKVRAINSRGEPSTDVQVGPFTLPATPIADGSITEVKIDDDAITAPKIKAGEITAAKLNVADVQASVVTADKINTLSLNASIITAGTIATARLNATEIQAAVVTAAAINALTLNAVTITGGTITGATVRTASSGQRMELNTFNLGGTLYPAVHMHTAANILAGYLYFDPENNGVILKNEITQTSLVLDSTLGAKLIGNVGFTGSLKPVTNCESGVSADGVWISDLSSASRRWKLYMYNPGTGYKLYMRYGSAGDEYRSV
jgi:hypothetical protein